MTATQGTPGDPVWEALWVKARFEHAQLWYMGGLALGFVPSLFFVDTDALVFGPRFAAIAFGLFSFALPAVAFRAIGRDKRMLGLTLAGGCMAIGAAATTLNPLVTVSASTVALAGALRAYRVLTDQTYRPHVMQAAIDTAQAQAARDTQET